MKVGYCPLCKDSGRSLGPLALCQLNDMLRGLQIAPFGLLVITAGVEAYRPTI